MMMLFVATWFSATTITVMNIGCLPEDDCNDGQWHQAASLNGGPLQTHQPNHQQLEDQHRNNDLVKGLPPYLQHQSTLSHTT